MSAKTTKFTCGPCEGRGSIGATVCWQCQGTDPRELPERVYAKRVREPIRDHLDEDWFMDERRGAIDDLEWDPDHWDSDAHYYDGRYDDYLTNYGDDSDGLPETSEWLSGELDPDKYERGSYDDLWYYIDDAEDEVIESLMSDGISTEKTIDAAPADPLADRDRERRRRGDRHYRSARR